MTKHCRSSRWWLLAGLCGLLGCISVPDHIQADFEPPNGQAPNNYGVFGEAPEGEIPRVRPDRPTIPGEGS